MIYCVEDDQNIRELILYALSNDGFEVMGLESGEELFEAIQAQIPQLILLDIMLPGKSGLEILDQIRKDPELGQIPIILLTAKSRELDRIIGLDKGADDYIVKPFSILELIARVKAVLRRTEPKVSKEQVLSIEGVSIDTQQRLVQVNGQAIKLTYKEFELLLYLFENENIVLDRDKILAHIWGYEYQGETRTVDVHIASLRQKLGDKGYLIKTIRNVGYKVGRQNEK